MESISTALVESQANKFFGSSNIFISPVLEATLRYIALKHHKGNIEEVQLIRCYRSEVYDSYFSNDSLNMLAPRTLNIFTVRRGYDVPTIGTPGWTPLDAPPFPVAPYLSKASETRVYYNKDLEKIVIFVKSLTEKWVDLLCSTLCRILFWIYADNEAISEEEQTLFRMFVQKNPDPQAFKAFIDTFASHIDFKSKIMKRMLIGWGKNTIEREITKSEREAERIRSDIRQYESSITLSYNNLASVMARCDALRETIPDVDTALYKFFETHKQLTPLDAIDDTNRGVNTLIFSITDTIEFYDEEQFKRVYNGRNTYIPDPTDDGNAAIRRILWGLFGSPKGAVRVESEWALDNLSSLRVRQNYRSGLFNYTHAPQPHQYFYGCLGGNGNYINRYMGEGNWDLAIEQAIASVKNLNFGDSAVCSRFVQWIRDNFNGVKCVVLPDGKSLSFNEFNQYLIECEEAEKAATAQQAAPEAQETVTEDNNNG